MAVNNADAILKLLGGKSAVRIIPGNYRGIDDGRALVDFNGGRVPANTMGVMPAVNDPVWVAIVDGVPFMVGPTEPRMSEGSVVSASAGVATVSTDAGQVTARYNSSVLTLSPSDVVFLLWGATPWIPGVLSAASTPEVPSAPGGTGARVTKTFTALSSRSYDSNYSSWWTNDVWSSANNKGLWFYGSKIRDTIPDSASIVKAEIYLPLKADPFNGSPPLGRHGYASQPAGAPTISSAAVVSGKSGWVTIPASLIDHLKSNTGGLGFNTSSQTIWYGTNADGQSGAVRVTYDT